MQRLKRNLQKWNQCHKLRSTCQWSNRSRWSGYTRLKRRPVLEGIFRARRAGRSPWNLLLKTRSSLRNRLRRWQAGWRYRLGRSRSSKTCNKSWLWQKRPSKTPKLITSPSSKHFCTKKTCFHNLKAKSITNWAASNRNETNWKSCSGKTKTRSLSQKTATKNCKTKSARSKSVCKPP